MPAVKPLLRDRSTKIPTDMPNRFLPLVDGRAFQDGKNPYIQHAVQYQPGANLRAEEFYIHHLLDTTQCSSGAIRRFNPAGVRRYLVEKFVEDRWVSEGNSRLSEMLEGNIRSNLRRFQALAEIRILDFGPSGGAITTLFALRALDRFGLMDKAKITLLDVVPDVVNMTIAGDFEFPQAMAEAYGLGFAGTDGSCFKRILSQAVPIISDFHDFDPGEKFHIILNAYTIHHLNIFDKADCAGFMESALAPNGAIAIVDFYVRSFDEYRSWLIRHLEANPSSPAPVESPYFTRKQIGGLFSGQVRVVDNDDALEKSWALLMERS